MTTKTLISKLPFALSARSLARPSPLLRLRSLIAVSAPSSYAARLSAVAGTRCFSSRPTTSSLKDPSPNWRNRPPKETILLEGCDLEHWLVVMESPEPEKTRDEIIDSYIKTLAQVVGSELEARMLIYSVSTKHYFAFGCKVSEELSYKIKPLHNVRWVLPDSYLDVKNQDYGGEPFINGQAVPYDPKYHAEWVRNNERAMERIRRNDRSHNSRNFERQRDNAQSFQNRDARPMQNQGFQNRDPQGAMPSQAPPVQPSHQNPPPPGGVPNLQNQLPNAQRGFVPNAGPGYHGNAQAYQGGGSPGTAPLCGAGYLGSGQSYQASNAGYQGGPPGYNQQGGHSGYQEGPANYNRQGGQSGYQGAVPNYQGGNLPQSGGYQGGSGYQPSGYQGGNSNYQQASSPFQGRDIPGRDQ